MTSDFQQAPTPSPKAPLGVIVLMWAVIICAGASVGYFFADYWAAQSELSVVNRQIRSAELSR